MATILVAFSGLISAVVLDAASHPRPSPRHVAPAACALCEKSTACCVRHSVMPSQPTILAQSGQEGTMRPYLKAVGMAFSLLAVWATLVQFVA